MTIENQTAVEQIEEILQDADVLGIRTILKNDEPYYVVSDIEDKFSEAFNAIRDAQAYEVANLVRTSNKSQTFEAWVISDSALEDLFSDLYNEQTKLDEESFERSVEFAQDHEAALDGQEDEGPTTPTAQHGEVTDIIVVDKSIKEAPTEDLTIKNIIKDHVRHYVYNILATPDDAADLSTRFQEGYRVLFTAALTSQGNDVSRDLLQEFFGLSAETCKLDWLIENGFGPSVLAAARRLFPITGKEDSSLSDETSSDENEGYHGDDWSE